MATSKPIAVLLVHPSDGTPDPNRPGPDFYTDFFLNDAESLNRYWLDASDGVADLAGTRVFGWRSHGLKQADFAKLNRLAKIQQAVAAFTTADEADRIDLSGFDSVAVFGDPADDGGSSGIQSFALPTGSRNFGTSIYGIRPDHAGVCHEVGHGFGFDHAFDDSPTPHDPANDGRPGAYGDWWDVMSYARCEMYAHPRFGLAGPTINATMRRIAGWLKPERVINGKAATLGRCIVYDVNDPDPAHPHVVAVDEYDFEFRAGRGWNRAGGAGVQIRTTEENSGTHSMIRRVNAGFGSPVYMMNAGDTFTVGNKLDIFKRHFTVTVDAIDPVAGSATLLVSYRVPQREPVVGPGIVIGGVASDGGGYVIINGHLIKIPPRGPREGILRNLAALEAVELAERAEVRRALVGEVLSDLAKNVEKLGIELRR